MSNDSHRPDGPSSEDLPVDDNTVVEPDPATGRGRRAGRVRRIAAPLSAPSAAGTPTRSTKKTSDDGSE